MTSPPHPSSPAPRHLLRPSLDYQHAFDWIAVRCHRRPGPVGLFASSAFYARELCKRLRGCDVALFPTGDWAPGADEPDWRGPELDGWEGGSEGPSSSPLASCVWAEPEMGDGQEVLQRIHNMLGPDAPIYILASDWLASVLPEWKGKDFPASRAAGARRCQAWLRLAGLVVEERMAVHGPASIAWGLAWQWLGRLGRDDWADRCHFRMRAAFSVASGQGFFSTVTVLAARKSLA